MGISNVWIACHSCTYLSKHIIAISSYSYIWDWQVPLSVFRWNSKFDQNLECSTFKYAQLITTKFCTWQNFVVLGRVYFKPEHFKFWYNFEFDLDIVSGMGARIERVLRHQIVPDPRHVDTFFLITITSYYGALIFVKKLNNAYYSRSHYHDASVSLGCNPP